MNKRVKRGLTVAGGVTGAGVSVAADAYSIIPEQLHSAINQVSTYLFSVLGPYQPSSSDIIAVLGLVVGAGVTHLGIDAYDKHKRKANQSTFDS